MPVDYQITGAVELEKIFAQLPLQYGKKPVIATFRKAGNLFKRSLKQNMPSRLKVLNRIISAKASRKGIYLNVGFFTNKDKVTLRDSKEWDAYYPVYWNNYGTMANRDSSHKWEQARKPGSKNWRGGIRAKKFVEKSWQQSAPGVESKIQTELKTQTIKFLNKHAVQ